MLSTIGELNLRDEYALLPHNAVLADVAKALSPVKNTAALIRAKSKKKGIAELRRSSTMMPSKIFSAKNSLKANSKSPQISTIKNSIEFSTK